MANEKRLIYVDSIKHEQENILFIGRNAGKMKAMLNDIVTEMIANCPTVDAVEVVRCGTCVHFAETKGKDSGKPCGDGKCMKPFFMQMIVDADDFCSYGERREECIHYIYFGLSR